MRIKDSAKRKKVFYVYKEHLLKMWGDYWDLFEYDGLWSYGSEKPVFFMKYQKFQKLEIAL